jgi:hypothetical protein
MKYILAFMMTLSCLHAQELTTQEEKKEEFLFDLQLNSLYKQKRVDITEDLNQKNKLIIQNLKELCDSDFTKNYLLQNLNVLQEENKKLKAELELSRKDNLNLEKINLKCESNLEEQFWNKVIIGLTTTAGAFAGSALCLQK